MDAEKYTENLKKAQQKPASRKKFIFYMIFLGILAAAAVYLTPKVIHAMHYETTDNAYIKGSLIPISAMVRGTISAVYIKDNMRVKQGDKLFELDQ